MNSKKMVKRINQLYTKPYRFIKFLVNGLSQKSFVFGELRLTYSKISIRKLQALEIKGIRLYYYSRKTSVVNIESVLIYPLVCKSIKNLSLTGKIYFSKIDCIWDVIADQDLYLDSILVNFQLSRRNRSFEIEIGDITCLCQIIRLKRKIEVYCEIPQISLNDYLDIIKGHISSGFLSDLFSVDRINIYGYLGMSGDNVDSLIFKSKITLDKLEIYDKKHPFIKEKEPLLDKQYLLNYAMDKTGRIKADSYISFAEIPSNLINALVCTEDPLFWIHGGISPYFIGYAIRSNLKSGKIVRGASTITMQLVRNLFLNHKRNFLRKIEEGIISLLIENYYPIGKKTIIEIYTNIIEFGPDVCGVNEASLFYFEKNIGELSLVEILVLTYIIPRPIHFYEALRDKSEQLKKNLCNHIKAYSKVMLRKQLITLEKFDEIDYTIQFSERFGSWNLRY